MSGSDRGGHENGLPAAAGVAQLVAPKAVFRMRIVDVDYSMCVPVPHVDISFSSFTASKLSRVPVIRIFGSTPAGQKVCLHIHKCFPYLYVPLGEESSLAPPQLEGFLQAFAAAIDRTLEAQLNMQRQYSAHSNSSSSSSSSGQGQAAGAEARSWRRHVYRLSVVHGYPFYGYCGSTKPFVKIELCDPGQILKLASVLLSGSILQRVWQPHESHIPYLLQFMADYNLFGMGFIDLCAVTFRRPMPARAFETAVQHPAQGTRRVTRAANTAPALAPAASASASASAGGPTRAPSVGSAFLAAFAGPYASRGGPAVPVSYEDTGGDPIYGAALQTPIQHRIWTASSTPAHLLASVHTRRITTCALEADGLVDHIVNRWSLLLANVPFAQRHHSDSAEGNHMFSALSPHIHLSQLPEDAKIVRSLASIWDNERRRRLAAMRAEGGAIIKEMPRLKLPNDTAGQNDIPTQGVLIRPSDVKLTPATSLDSRQVHSPDAIAVQYRLRLRQIIDLERRLLALCTPPLPATNRQQSAPPLADASNQLISDSSHVLFSANVSANLEPSSQPQFLSAEATGSSTPNQNQEQHTLPLSQNDEQLLRLLAEFSQQSPLDRPSTSLAPTSTPAVLSQGDQQLIALLETLQGNQTEQPVESDGNADTELPLDLEEVSDDASQQEIADIIECSQRPSSPVSRVFSENVYDMDAADEAASPVAFFDQDIEEQGNEHPDHDPTSSTHLEEVLSPAEDADDITETDSPAPAPSPLRSIPQYDGGNDELPAAPSSTRAKPTRRVGLSSVVATAQRTNSVPPAPSTSASSSKQRLHISRVVGQEIRNDHVFYHVQLAKPNSSAIAVVSAEKLAARQDLVDQYLNSLSSASTSSISPIRPAGELAHASAASSSNHRSPAADTFPATMPLAETPPKASLPAQRSQHPTSPHALPQNTNPGPSVEAISPLHPSQSGSLSVMASPAQSVSPAASRLSAQSVVPETPPSSREAPSPAQSPAAALGHSQAISLSAVPNSQDSHVSMTQSEISRHSDRSCPLQPAHEADPIEADELSSVDADDDGAVPPSQQIEDIEEEVEASVVEQPSIESVDSEDLVPSSVPSNFLRSQPVPSQLAVSSIVSLSVVPPSAEEAPPRSSSPGPLEMLASFSPASIRPSFAPPISATGEFYDEPMPQELTTSSVVLDSMPWPHSMPSASPSPTQPLPTPLSHPVKVEMQSEERFSEPRLERTPAIVTQTRTQDVIASGGHRPALPPLPEPAVSPSSVSAFPKDAPHRNSEKLPSQHSGSAPFVAETPLENSHSSKQVLTTSTPLHVYQWPKPAPTVSHLLCSLKRYGFPLVQYQEPYFSNAAHVPSKPTVFGGVTFRLGGSPQDPANLEEFVSTFSRQHQRRPITEASYGVTSASLPSQDPRFRFVLTPVRPPPSPMLIAQQLEHAASQQSAHAASQHAGALRGHTTGARDSYGRELFLRQPQAGVAAATERGSSWQSPAPLPGHVQRIADSEKQLAERLANAHTSQSELIVLSAGMASATSSQQHTTPKPAAQPTQPLSRPSPASTLPPLLEDIEALAPGFMSHRDEIDAQTRQAFETELNGRPATNSLLNEVDLPSAGKDSLVQEVPDEPPEERPVSPKYDELFLNGLSYFLPSTPAARPRGISTPSRSKPSPSASLASPVAATVTPAKRRLRLSSQPSSTVPPEKNGVSIASAEVSPLVNDPTTTTTTTTTTTSFAAIFAKHAAPGPTVASTAKAEPAAPNPPAPVADTTADEEHAPQHLTVLSVEIHVQTRPGLLPNSNHDPIMAITFTVRTDAHAELPGGGEHLGVLMHLGAEHGRPSPAPPRCGVSPLPLKLRLGIRAHKHNVGYQGSAGVTTGSADAADDDDKAAGVGLEPLVYRTELEMLEAFIQLVHYHDPDIILGYEIQKSSLGFIIERTHHLWDQSPVAADHERDMADELSRVPPAHRLEAVVSANPSPDATFVHLFTSALPQSSFTMATSPFTTASSGPSKASVAQNPASAVAAASSSSTSSSGRGGPSSAPASAVALSFLAAKTPAQRYARRKGSGIAIAGRIVLNVWRIMRSELKLNIYTFENVAMNVLGVRVPHFSSDTLSQWWQYGQSSLLALAKEHGISIESAASPSFGASPAPQATGHPDAAAQSENSSHQQIGGRWSYLTRVLDYFLARSFTTLLILDRLDLITRTSELARVFGIQFFGVLSRGSQYRVESMMIRIAKQLNYILTSPSAKQVAEQPAMEAMPLVMEPESRLYSSPVLVLDFQSLYPSTVIAYNLCYSTCLGRLPSSTAVAAATAGASPLEKVLGVSRMKLPLGLLEELEDNIWISPNGVMFARPKARQGLLPRLLKEILDTRVMVKNSMKDPAVKANKALHRLLNARQFGLKMIANVTYGYTAAGFSGRMPMAELADSIVQTARETLEGAIRIVESDEKWQARVVYGDTDSLFVVLPGRTRQEAFRIGAEIVKRVTASNPRPVKLQLEKVYHPCVLLSKKRYVGFSYESVAQVTPTFDAKGIETVRRDSCPLVANMMEKSLRILFSTKDLSLVRSYLERQWTDILAQRLPIQEFIFAKEVKLGTYRAATIPPAAIVATKKMRSDPRAEPLYGERVPYVVVEGSPGARLVDMVVAPEAVLQNPHSYRLNARYYIEKQINAALARVFHLVGADVAGWFAAMPRPRLLSRPTPQSVFASAFASSSSSASSSSDLVSTTTRGRRIPTAQRIDHYYTSQHCIICDQPGLDVVCIQCSRRPQETALVLLSRVKARERHFQQLINTCLQCSSRVWCTEAAGTDPEQASRYPYISSFPQVHQIAMNCDSLDCSVLAQRSQSGNTLNVLKDQLRQSKLSFS